jgi:hypothetical protein
LTGIIPDSQRVFARHVIKPVSKKQSDLTVYFVSDNVGATSDKTHYKLADYLAGA